MKGKKGTPQFDLDAVGSRLRMLIAREGFSAAYVARELGTYDSTMSAWTQGQAAPSLKYIIAICKMFKVSTDYLLTGKTK